MDVGRSADGTQVAGEKDEEEGLNLRDACLGLSVRWLKLTQTFWSIVVRPSRRSVTKECLLGYLNTLEWYIDGEINREEYLLLHAEWLLTSKEKSLNRFTLAHLREVLIERECFQESKLEEWIRLVTGEYHSKVLNKPLCYNRSSAKDDLNVSTMSGGSRGNKSTPTHPSTLEYVNDAWLAQCRSIFDLLDRKRCLSWGFEETLFFVSALEVASSRHTQHEAMNVHEMAIEQEAHVSSQLALNRLSAKALAVLEELGGSFWYSSTRRDTQSSMRGKRGSSSPFSSSAVVSESMLINFFYRRRAGLAFLRKLHALLQLVLQTLQSLLSVESCPFDGLSQDMPALWSGSVRLAGGFDMEREAAEVTAGVEAESLSRSPSALAEAMEVNDEAHEAAVMAVDEMITTVVGVDEGDTNGYKRSHKRNNRKSAKEKQKEKGKEKDNEVKVEDNEDPAAPSSSSSSSSVLQGSEKPSSPLFGISLFLLSDALRLVPATFFVIDDGIGDLAFRPSHEHGSQGERICAKEIQAIASRLQNAQAAWMKGGAAVPTAFDEDGAKEAGRADAGGAKPRGGGLSGQSKAKAPTKNGSGDGRVSSDVKVRSKDASVVDPVLQLYLGVLVEYKNIHLQLCDALVSVHPEIWAELAALESNYPSQEELESLVTWEKGETLLEELTAFYRPREASELRKLARAEAAQRKEEEEREREKEELEAARREERRRRTAREAARARAKIVEEREVARKRAVQPARNDSVGIEGLRAQAPSPAPASPLMFRPKRVQHRATDNQTTALPSSDDKETEEDPRENDPDHLFWKLRTASSTTEKEALLARLKVTAYGGGREDEADDSATAYYDHSPNPAAREGPGSDSSSLKLISTGGRRGSTGPGMSIAVAAPSPQREVAMSPLSSDGTSDSLSSAFATSPALQPTSINEMLERGMDAGSQAKKLRNHLRSMSSGKGRANSTGNSISEKDAQELLEMGRAMVISMEGGGGGKKQNQRNGNNAKKESSKKSSRQAAPITPTSSRVPGKLLGPASSRQPLTKSGVGLM